jgi:circadian clock protein KaiB
MSRCAVPPRGEDNSAEKALRNTMTSKKGSASNPPETANQVVELLLYVADNTPNSVTAVHNLTAICEAHLPGRYEIEIVDVFKQPDRARADHVVMTPTLIRPTPPPVRRMVGTLRQPAKVLQALGLGPAKA